MKSFTKLSFLTATVAVIATSAAFADDQQLQNQIALRRAQETSSPRTTTVGVYANDRGVGRSAAQGSAEERRFELRSTARGQTYGVFVPVK